MGIDSREFSDLERKGSFHFIGIGGISMSGIARLLLEKGYQVSGSDLKDSDLLQTLRVSGARISIGHDPKNISGAGVVVISSAIPEDNCEVQEARRLGLPVWQRAQMIAKIMENKKGIAIAGTHGKTTTTSMASLLLEKNDFDPTVLIGGELNDLGGNAKLGRGELVVTEADESDGSFLFFSPEIALITNIELDHPDYFSSYQMVLNVFQKFMKKVSPQGKIILCIDDPGIKEAIALETPQTPILSYGLGNGDLQGREVVLNNGGSNFKVFFRGEKLGEINLRVPGKHNVYNSLGVIGIGLTLGLEFPQIKKGLEAYKGVQRRFEEIGLVGGVRIIDDYAHHPTEIEATINAARSTDPNRVLAIFQPHRYSRTSSLQTGFAEALDKADIVIVTSIYSASEKPIPGVSGEKIVNLIKEKGKENKAIYCPKLEDIPKIIGGDLKPGDLVLTLGAGDVFKVGPLLRGFLETQEGVSAKRA